MIIKIAAASNFGFYAQTGLPLLEKEGPLQSVVKAFKAARNPKGPIGFINATGLVKKKRPEGLGHLLSRIIL